MTQSQYYGWSREDAAPLNEPLLPRKPTWLSIRREAIARCDKLNADKERVALENFCSDYLHGPKR